MCGHDEVGQVVLLEKGVHVYWSNRVLDALRRSGESHEGGGFPLWCSAAQEVVLEDRLA